MPIKWDRREIVAMKNGVFLTVAMLIDATNRCAVLYDLDAVGQYVGYIRDNEEIARGKLDEVRARVELAIAGPAKPDRPSPFDLVRSVPLKPATGFVRPETEASPGVELPANMPTESVPPELL